MTLNFCTATKHIWFKAVLNPTTSDSFKFKHAVTVSMKNINNQECCNNKQFVDLCNSCTKHFQFVQLVGDYSDAVSV